MNTSELRHRLKEIYVTAMANPKLKGGSISKAKQSEILKRVKNISAKIDYIDNNRKHGLIQKKRIINDVTGRKIKPFKRTYNKIKKNYSGQFVINPLTGRKIKKNGRLHQFLVLHKKMTGSSLTSGSKKSSKKEIYDTYFTDDDGVHTLIKVKRKSKSASKKKPSKKMSKRKTTKKSASKKVKRLSKKKPSKKVMSKKKPSKKVMSKKKPSKKVTKRKTTKRKTTKRKSASKKKPSKKVVRMSKTVSKRTIKNRSKKLKSALKK